MSCIWGLAGGGGRPLRGTLLSDAAKKPSLLPGEPVRVLLVVSFLFLCLYFLCVRCASLGFA